MTFDKGTPEAIPVRKGEGPRKLAGRLLPKKQNPKTMSHQNGNGNGNGSLLRVLREEKQLSQRRLAEQCGISRGRLQRLENGQFGTATYEELQRIAKVLEVGVERLFEPEGPILNGAQYGRTGQNFFQYEDPGGEYRILSLTELRPDFFIGKLILQARASISSKAIPRTGTFFLQPLVGGLRVEFSGKHYEIREGDHLVFSAHSDYHFENLQFREQVSFMMTYPCLKF